MKKLLFLTSIFLVSGFLLYFMMKGGTTTSEPGNLGNIKDNIVVAMVDSVKVADWKNNAQYLRIKTEIGLRESNGKINASDKELLISTLDINYALSLNKKYNTIKVNFTSFPSELYNEMISYQTKNKDLPIYIGELNAFRRLEQMEGVVNQFLNGRFNIAKSNSLRAQINEIPIGSLAGNPLCSRFKSSYYQKIGGFQGDVQTVTELIDTAEKYPEEYSRYKELGDWKNESSVLKYSFYKAWFNNPENQRFL